ncbi:MAG: hypothetical protein KF802_08245 [Bdellovibrionaceae bacterium]|nr:hypothetical protein [Pseudobdellovibrionaceae bacterium]
MTNENILNAITVASNDREKWALADWIVRQQWLYRLIDYHQKILDNRASPAEYDMFWIKLYGLIREFNQPMKESIEGLEVILNIDSAIYAQFTSPEQKEEIRLAIQGTLANEREFVALVNHSIEIVTKIRTAFTDNEILFLIDQRTHAAHPTADFYKFKIGRNGQLQDQFNGLSKAEVQDILKSEYIRHQGESKSLATTANAAIYYAKKIKSTDLNEILSDIRKISAILNPISVLF